MGVREPAEVIEMKERANVLSLSFKINRFKFKLDLLLLKMNLEY